MIWRKLLGRGMSLFSSKPNALCHNLFTLHVYWSYQVWVGQSPGLCSAVCYSSLLQPVEISPDVVYQWYTTCKFLSFHCNSLCSSFCILCFWCLRNSYSSFTLQSIFLMNCSTSDVSSWIRALTLTGPWPLSFALCNLRLSNFSGNLWALFRTSLSPYQWILSLLVEQK